MQYQNEQVRQAAEALRSELEVVSDKKAILRSPVLTALYDQIKITPAEQRAAFGKEVNSLKQELEGLIKTDQAAKSYDLSPLDVTAPFDINIMPQNRPVLLRVEDGSKHPLMIEREVIVDIFGRMGFTAVESREIDDDYHMFSSLNFPEGHPARDDYDSFVTDEGLIAPAHTSTMQNRILKQHKDALANGRAIAVIIPDRVFRNEDLDARHEHTFYQIEGIYVDEGIHAGHLVATIRTWLSTYYGKDIEIKIQPFYFPFTEPSFEFAASCIFCDGKGCGICSHTGWIELGGCGMIHPNVLSEAGIDPKKYTGFAWGFGIDRLVMLRYNIEDIRHFLSGNLEFLKQFS